MTEIRYPKADDAPLTDPANYVYADRPDNPCKTYSYDDANDVTTVTNEEGFVSKFYYDGLGHLVTVKRYKKGTQTSLDVEYGYDSQWNITSVKDAKANVTAYGYDAYGRINGIILPRDANDILFTGNPTAAIVYDDTALTHTITDPSGRVRKEYYDAAGRMTDVELGAETEKISAHYIYDGFGGRLTETDPSTGVTAYDYNSLGQVAAVTLPEIDIWDSGLVALRDMELCIFL